MTNRQKALRLRKYLNTKTTTDLYKEYKAGQKQQTLYTQQSDIVARDLLQTVKTYEEYIKLLQEELKTKIKYWRGKYVRLYERFKQQERELRKFQQSGLANRAVSGKFDVIKHPSANNVGVQGKQINVGVKSVIGVKAKGKQPVGENIPVVESYIENQLIKAKQTLKLTSDRFRVFYERQRLESRGDDPGESMGKESHPEKDPYEKILGYIERNGHIFLNEKAKAKLRNATGFKEAFYNRFSKTKTTEEINKMWEDNFGAYSTAYYTAKDAMDDVDLKNVNWSLKRKARTK